ncbi:MAG: redoxin domain-containing protein [Dehalococcoidia bacterium]|nr:redoxin domain-containing protein [Dehalococcoidia bacterium]MDD5494778.1 redoxin domain-containing protein [Dehalococcoidia bacterium]
MDEKIRKIKAGDIAPDFTLKDHDGNDFKLSSYSGKNVLLSFHPLAWTAVCTQQMQSLEEQYETFQTLNTVPVGLSVDPIPSKKAWADNIGIKKIPLLSDFWPHGAVAALYDIFREKNGFSERANIIIDTRGNIALLKTYPLSQLPNIQEIIAVVKVL